MASYNMNPLPELETGTTLDQVNRNLKVVKNWLYQLDEQLRYNLYNMELDNMTTDTVDKLTSVNDEVKAALTVLDGKITAAVESADGRFSELVVDINGITTRVGDAEGNISTLKQTATSLTSAVSDAQGNISALQQTAGSIQSQVSDIENNVSSVSQTANKINWVVAGGYSASSMTLTDSFLNIVTNKVILSDALSGNYASISVNSYGTYLEQNAGTLYLGSSNGYVYARNSFDANYIYCRTQIRCNGNIVADGQVNANSGLFDSWCYAPSWENGSDRNLKKDIETLSGDEYVPFILSLSPVQYRYKSDEAGRVHLGFIAQEVEEQLNKIGEGGKGILVSHLKLNEGSEEETLTLNYTDLIAPLVKAVQTLDKRVRALEGEGNA